MAQLPSIEDLTLVHLIRKTGSIGAAATHMLISQPSASSRLTRLERRLGTRLFQRGARGTIPTAAGQGFCQEAEFLLKHLEHVVQQARLTSTEPVWRIGCFHSLADSILPLIDASAHAQGRELVQYADHGNTLVDGVAEGKLDAAVVSIANQRPLPANVSAHEIGRDEMVLFCPNPRVGATKGKQPLKDMTLPTAAYDLRREELSQRILSLGGIPRFGATITGTIRMARLSQDPAILPRSAALLELQEHERIERLPFSWQLRLSLVTRPSPSESLRLLAQTLTSALGLSPDTGS